MGASCNQQKGNDTQCTLLRGKITQLHQQEDKSKGTAFLSTAYFITFNPSVQNIQSLMPLQSIWSCLEYDHIGKETANINY